jgi:hypothetical protein
MKKVFCILISAGIVFLGLTLFSSKSVNADNKSVYEMVAPVDGYHNDDYQCPNGKVVYRCWDGGSGCDVSKQDLC